MPVHRDRQRLVRFLADRTVAHRARREALHDLLRRLHFLHRNRLVGILQLQQPAQRTVVPALIVDQVRVFLERCRIVLPHSVLQLADRLRIQQVILAAFAVLVLPAHHQVRLRIGQRLECVGVLHLRFARQHVQPDALHARRSPREVRVHQRLVQAHRLKHLRAAIALQRADAHLREGLQQALVDGLDEVLLRVLGRHVVRQQPAPLQIVQRLDRQVRIDRAGAVADQQRKVHHLARLAALDDQRNLRARLLAHQPIVHRGHRQQARNRRIASHPRRGPKESAACSPSPPRAPRGCSARPALRFRPASPSSARNSAGSVVASRSPDETRRSFSRSRLVRIGCGSFSVWQFSGASSRMLRSVPI